MRSTSGGSCVAASKRTVKSMIQCDGVLTTFMAKAGERRWPPRTVAYRWCMPSCPPAGKYPPPPLQTPGVAHDGLPGGGGRWSPSDGLRGGGGIARVFQGKLWYPPLTQAKRTRVKRLLR